MCCRRAESLEIFDEFEEWHMIQVRRHHKLLHRSLLDCRDIPQRMLFRK